jgi:hypothetical protein
MRIQTSWLGKDPEVGFWVHKYQFLHGDDLDPLLALEFILRRINIELKRTISYKFIKVLAYAGDITIISRSLSDATEICNELATTAKEIGLENNIK